MIYLEKRKPVLYLVEKARTPKEYKALHAVADQMQPVVKASLASGIKKFQGQINLQDIVTAIQEGKWATLSPQIINWNGFDKILRDSIEQDFKKTLVKAGTVSIPFFREAVRKLIPQIDEVAIPFSLQNPRIEAWLTGHLADLKGNLELESIQAIDRVITLNYNLGMPPRSTARLIRGSIGLNERQATALSTYRAGLESRGIGGMKLDQMVGGYSDQLIKQRAEMIANTETINAVNKGQLEVWNQAEEAGLIETAKTQKAWITTPDDVACTACVEMDNQTVGLDEDFYSSELDVSVDSPTLHPNCRCAMEIVFND